MDAQEIIDQVTEEDDAKYYGYKEIEGGAE